MNKRQRTRARLALYRIHNEIGELKWLIHESASSKTPVVLAQHNQRALDDLENAYKVLNEWMRSLPL